MATLEQQLKEDRAVRDAARRLLETDLGLVKSDVHSRGLGERTADRLREGSQDIADEAMDYARTNPLLVFGGLAAVLLFLFRNPILDLVLSLSEDEEDTPFEEAGFEPRRAADETELDEPQDGSQRRQGF